MCASSFTPTLKFERAQKLKGDVVQVWHGGRDRWEAGVGAGRPPPPSMASPNSQDRLAYQHHTHYTCTWKIVQNCCTVRIKSHLKKIVIKISPGFLQSAIPSKLLKSNCRPGSCETKLKVRFCIICVFCVDSKLCGRFATLVSSLKQVSAREKFPEESVKPKLQESFGRVRITPKIKLRKW